MVNIVSAINRFGIFPKLVFTFLITILPLYFISLQFNHMGANTVKKEILTSMGTRAHFYLNSFEAELQRTMRLQRQFVVDDDLITLSTLTAENNYYDLYEMLQFQQRIQNKLLLMENSSSYIEKASVYIPRLKKAFLSSTIKSELTDADIKAFIPGERIPNPLPALRYEQGRLILRTIPPEPSYLHKVPDFIIEADISRFAVEQFLDRMTYRSDEGVTLLDDLGQWQMDNKHDNSITQSLNSIVRHQTNGKQSSGQLNILVNEKQYLLSYEHSTVLGATMVVFVPEKQILGPLHKYNVSLWWLSGVSFLVVLVFSYWIYRLIHNPMMRLVLALRKMEKGDLTIAIHRSVQDEFHYLYLQFNSMVLRIKELIQENYESRIIAQRLELKQLQSQINPHFLYNTYFMIHRMAESDDLANVRMASKYMGLYFMYITRNSSDEVTLQAEIEHTNNYIDIQTLRFSHRIRTITGDIPAVCSTVRVPRLILQPLVENAYQHGMKSKVTAGLICFQVIEVDDYISISIEDNSEDLNDRTLHDMWRQLSGSKTVRESTGMVNVHLRLQLYFGRSYGLQLSRGQLGGLKVEIRIPKTTDGRFVD
jgi:two-component system sensor histidine kinase YesM